MTAFRLAMRYPNAFALGMYEFRRMWTTHFAAGDEFEAYDWGREIAHRLTLRHFDR